MKVFYTKELVLIHDFTSVKLKKMLLVIPLLLFFSTAFALESPPTSAFSILKPQKANEVAFYKSPNSQFPSGHTTFEKLTKTQIETVEHDSYYYLHKNQKISPSLVKVTTASDLSESTQFRDTGFALVLKKTVLRQKAQINSATLLNIPAGTKLKPLSYKNGFIQTRIGSVTGFINISDCITKFDFAKAVYAKNPITQKSQWFYIKNRTFDHIETLYQFLIPLSEIEGIYPDANKAIVTDNSSILPLWTSLKIEYNNTDQWIKSRVDGHGLVYWKKTKSVTDSAESKIKIDELLKREIAFVSFNPKNPRKAIASSQGLYITEDGENWKEIPAFKNFNGPVLYFNDFLIYAGSFRSTDGGKTFEQFFQIEKIATTLSENMGVDPKKMKMTQIKIIKPFKIEVDIDIGVGRKRIKLQTPVYSQDWKIVNI